MSIPLINNVFADIFISLTLVTHLVYPNGLAPF
jgi:hypothetical protein